MLAVSLPYFHAWLPRATSCQRAHAHDRSIRGLICPSGSLRNFVSSPLRKNILLFRKRKSAYIHPRLVPQRGVSRSSRTRGGMRWTRQRRACNGIAGRIALRERYPARRTNGAFFAPSPEFDGPVPGPAKLLAETGRVRRSRVVLTPRCWRQVGGGFWGPDRVSKNLNPPMTVTTSRSPGRSRISRKTIACGNAGLIR
jgi:hypothetical protein